MILIQDIHLFTLEIISVHIILMHHLQHRLLQVHQEDFLVAAVVAGGGGGGGAF